jgi:hypothetical protein
VQQDHKAFKAIQAQLVSQDQQALMEQQEPQVP